MKIWFGIHEGKDHTELPSHYLRWVATETQPQINEGDSPELRKLKREKWLDLISAAEEELEERGDF